MYSVDESLLNTWGGSVSIGHPFGATGVRLLSHAANRHAPDTPDTIQLTRWLLPYVCCLLTFIQSSKEGLFSGKLSIVLKKEATVDSNGILIVSM